MQIIVTLLAAGRRGGHDCTPMAADRRGEMGEQQPTITAIGERARDTASSCSWTTTQQDSGDAQRENISEPAEQVSESTSVGRTLSDWECRKRARLKKAALDKDASYARWLTTNVPAALRTKFPHLFKHEAPQPHKDTG